MCKIENHTFFIVILLINIVKSVIFNANKCNEVQIVRKLIAYYLRKKVKAKIEKG